MSGGNDWDTNIVNEFRVNGGKVGGPFEGAPLLILHTTGAKSGEERVHPLMYQAVDGKYAIFASKGGAPTNPAWYHNLLSNPETTIEIGTETKRVTAHEVTGAEREPIWETQKERYPGFADYETKTSRTIPVVILEPVE
ncbi:MAG: nitroreductase family deazaflavin-dependent oxidoreductase [Nitrolancea sp.]